MTMMALTRRRHRAVHLWALAVGLLAVAAVAVGVKGSGVSAINEGDVQFSVTQTPAAGAMVQVGSTVTFDVAATVSAAPIGIPLYFEFDYPAGLAFVSGVSTPAGVTCADNVPNAGVVRCSYGLVLAGPRVPLTLTFTVNATATTAASQAMIRGGGSDGAPDTAADGVDDTFTGAGTLTTFGPATISPAGGANPPAIFEGSTTAYTATLQNTSGAATGTFNAALNLTNGVATSVTCSAGAAGGTGTPVATCAGAGLAASETLTITATVFASNTSDGADIGVALSAPALGILQVLPGVTVWEVGLDSTGAAPAAGVAVNVCTAAVPGDVSDDAAAGEAQPNNSSLVGQLGNLVLQTSDFQVAGPGVGTVTAATGCATNQSGVRFTPSAGGAYTVTALYNTGGTNVLALTVAGGAANNPMPSAGSLAPSAANAGSGGFTLTVTGSGFVASSVVRWNASPLSTTYISPTQLEAAVPAGNIAGAGSATVTVLSPTPGGGTSNGLTFTINAAPNPVPTLSGLSPNTIGAGAAQFQMTVTGTNFVAGSVVRWEGVDLATAYVSPTSLTATVPAARVASAGAANITVFNPGPGGGSSVTPQVFTITASAAKLAFTTQPGAGVAGTALGAQPVVAVQTAANATVTNDSTTVVTLSLNGSGTLTCTGGLSKTVTAGVASFAGCTVSQAGDDYTITASATGLTSATSGTFDVTAAPPTASAQVTVTNPSSGMIPRSRLVFAVSTGNLNGTEAGFIIKRKSDGKYWNNETADWQTELVLNEAADAEGNAWSLSIVGDARREFAGTVVTLEARVTVAGTVYVNATIPELQVR